MKNTLQKFPYAILATLLILNACTVGPDYQAPEISAPPLFVLQDVLKSLNEGKEDQDIPADWWTGFESETLNEIVKRSLENNFELVAAMANVKEAKAQLSLAGVGDNFTANVNIDSSAQERRELNNNEDTTTTNGVGAGLGFALPVDVSGKIRKQVEAAKANLDAAQANLKGTLLDVSADVVSEYLSLRGDQKQLELLREAVSLQEQTLKIVTSRYNAGLSPELDLRRAEASVENLRANIPPLVESLQNSRNRIARLAGEFPGVYEALLKEKSSVPNYKKRVPENIPLHVLKMRPDIAQAEANLKQAIANIGVAEADYYPALRLSAQIGITSTGFSGSTTTDILLASINALLQQVLTSGGRIDAQVAIAKARAEEALANYEQALRQASEEVEISLAALQSSQARQNSLQKSVTASARSFKQAETLYQQGLISFLDVVDAQRTLANAEQSLARERTNYATQISSLFNALGTPVNSSDELRNREILSRE